MTETSTPCPWAPPTPATLAPTDRILDSIRVGRVTICLYESGAVSAVRRRHQHQPSKLLSLSIARSSVVTGSHRGVFVKQVNHVKSETRVVLITEDWELVVKIPRPSHVAKLQGFAVRHGVQVTS